MITTMLIDVGGPILDEAKDFRLAAFTSDATGITRVCVVSVPEEMRSRLAVA